MYGWKIEWTPTVAGAGLGFPGLLLSFCALPTPLDVFLRLVWHLVEQLPLGSVRLCWWASITTYGVGWLDPSTTSLWLWLCHRFCWTISACNLCQIFSIGPGPITWNGMTCLQLSVDGWTISLVLVQLIWLILWYYVRKLFGVGLVLDLLWEGEEAGIHGSALCQEDWDVDIQVE